MIRRTLLTALLASLAPGALRAQEAPGRTHAWVAAGLGAGVPASGGDGIANLAQIVVQRRAHQFALRGLVLHDLDRGTDTIGELGVLYGRTRAFPWGYVAAAGGVSAGAFDTCPDDDDTCFAPGIPLSLDVAVTGRLLGVGVQAFGNVNSKASYAGATVFLLLGRLP